jgi:hypothetical protein
MAEMFYGSAATAARARQSFGTLMFGQDKHTPAPTLQQLGGEPVTDRPVMDDPQLMMDGYTDDSY